MNIKRLDIFILTALLVTGFVNIARAQEKIDKVGTTAAAWLKIGVGGRAAGMGESYTAICDDASAIFWNPANLSRVRKTQFMAQYGMWLAEMGYHAVSFAIPMKGKKKEKSPYEATPFRNQYPSRYEPFFPRFNYRQPKKEQKEVPQPGGTIGIGISYFDYGLLPSMTKAGVSGEDFPANAYCAMLSYSNVLGETICIGVTAKMISETIDTETETAFAGDVGLSLTTGSEDSKFSLGVVMQNMGATLKDSELPQNTKAGIGIQLGPLTISGDYNMPNDHEEKINAGVEFKLGGMLAIRGGYMMGTDDVGEGMSGLSAGVGLDMGGFCMDVAYVPFGDYLGNTYRASILFKF